jgi:phosphoribosyl-ATP pyrophosphohydrolase/phosphoribosyl-AMP cyclohydrolase
LPAEKLCSKSTKKSQIIWRKKMLSVDDLKFDGSGLIPVVVQDFNTGEVLTLAYMNRESLLITISERRACFWSRSRRELWRKGETSGNIQYPVAIRADCDRDALVMEVLRDGPACHTGAESCFFDELFRDAGKGEAFDLNSLCGIIQNRKKSPQPGSYTSYLFEKGLEKILKKIGEESSEVVIAAMKGDRRETIFEISDLCYHLLVLMAQAGISTDDIMRELASRQVVDKKVKQETLK